MSEADGLHVAPYLDRDPDLPVDPTVPFRPPREGPHAADVERLARDGLLHRLIADVYVAADPPVGTGKRAAALGLLVPPGAIVGFATAAWLHTGWAPGRTPLDNIDVIITPGVARSGGSHIRLRQVRLSPEHVISAGGIDATSLARTAADLAREAPAGDLVGALDALAARGLDLDQVLDCLTTMRYCRHVRPARHRLQAWAEARAVTWRGLR
jgi:hypothetical protein